MSNFNIAVIGLGTVGQGVVEIIEKNEEKFFNLTGRHIKIVAVSAQNKDKKRDIDIAKYKWLDSPTQVLDLQDIDVVIELIGGDEGVAKDLAEATLKKGINFITANKALMASHGYELAKLAEKNKASIFYEAAIAGGIPIVKALREGVIANEITEVVGILNGTCNYILSEMEENQVPFDKVLKEAQDKGYAEAEPSLDIDGFDTAHKICLLSSLAFGTVPNLENIQTEGVRGIDNKDITYAKDFGYKIRLVGKSVTDNGVVKTSVFKCLFKKDHPLANVKNATNAVVVESKPLGQTVYIGQGAGRGATASAVVADIIDLAKGNKTKCFNYSTEKLIKPSDKAHDSKSKYYLRIEVEDKVGVMSKVTELLNKADISIDKINQIKSDNLTDIILITNDQSFSNISDVSKKLSHLDGVVSKPEVIKIN